MICTSPAARGLFQAILADPSDDVPRLLLADVLEEAGEGERAEFIRVQCELARIVGVDPDCCKKLPFGRHWSTRGEVACAECWPRKDTLRRERELLDEYGFDWFGQFTRAAHVDEGRGPDRNAWNFRSLGGTLGWCLFRRGFIHRVDCTLAGWCGEACPRCHGDGGEYVQDEEAEAYNEMIGRHPMIPPARRETCEVCHGTGRTGGHGPALVKAAPIEEVAFTDKRPWIPPANSEQVWHWQAEVHAASTDHADAPWIIPNALADLIGTRAGAWTDHDSEQEALAALSHSALALARQEAGLPALA